MGLPLDFIEVGFDELTDLVRSIAASGSTGHIHTTVPGCAITSNPRRAIVLETSEASGNYAYFSDEPIEARARPLAIALHGAESVPGDEETLTAASEVVQVMGRRMREGKGHFHILNPVCRVNPHPGKWTILFEDSERGLMESVSVERPLADIRFVERLIYARPA